jgi:hypothetical protein
MHPPHAADAPSDIHRLNRTRLLPSSVFHSWFNDECPDDESGNDNDGQRYKKGFHDLTPSVDPLLPPGSRRDAPRPVAKNGRACAHQALAPLPMKG